MIDLKNTDIAEIKNILDSIVDKNALETTLKYPFINYSDFSLDLEVIFVDFLKQRAKYLISILDKSNYKTPIQRELFDIYDALKDEDNLADLILEMIDTDYNFIYNQRIYMENKDASHRKKMNTVYQKYWNDMHIWNNTNEEKMQVFTKVFSEIKYNSASLKVSDIKDWDAFAFGYIPKLLQAKTKLEFYENLIEMVNKIGDNHNYLAMPYDIVKNFSNPDLEIVFLKNSFFVKTDCIISNKNIDAGDEIIKIQGMEVNNYIKENQSTYPFIKYYHFKPKLASFYNMAKILLTHHNDNLLTVTFKKSDNTTYNFTFAGNEKNESKKIEESQEIMTFKMLEDNILYIEITTFWHGDVYKIFKDGILKYDLNKVKGIIFDVRNNSGGNSAYCDKIFSHFIKKTIKNYFFDYSKVYIPHYYLNGISDLKVYDSMRIHPSKDFLINLPVAILTSPVSCSATEDFVFLFKYYKRATIIGLPTGGSTGNALFSILKGGGELRVNLDVALYFSCKGIAPDIYVDYSITDFINKKDPQLKSALDFLTK